MKLAVDVTHTYIGDLTITLAAPDGRSVRVHDRNGGGTANLKKTWSTADTPALVAFAGAPIAGDWRLKIVDAAPADTGKLKAWTLTIQPRAASDVTLSDVAGIAIPDNLPAGVSRNLACAATGTIAEIVVEVDITHTYIGDLKVALLAPSGARVLLHDGAGGSADNLIRSWNSSSTAELSGLVGAPAAGTWTLQVSDHAAVDTGKLNRWGIRLAIIPAQ